MEKELIKGEVNVMERLELDYYYGIEAEQYSFFRIPRLLIKDKRYRDLRSDAVMHYPSLMLDLPHSGITSLWGRIAAYSNGGWPLAPHRGRLAPHKRP